MNGIIFGLGAASLQSVCYLLSRGFFSRPGRSPWLLLVVSHTIMGIISLLAFPFYYPQDMQWSLAVIMYTAGSGGFYLIGQQAMFMALRYIDASRLAPLLGAKILFLALFSSLIGGQSLSHNQWFAVLLSMLGIYVLNEAGGRLAWRGLVCMGVAIVFYSLSDLSIIGLVESIGSNSLRGSMFGAILTYIMCGLVMAPFLAHQSAAARWETWRASSLYSALWLAAMVLLYACFAEIGAVFGNIVQSTRGLISIMLGVLMAKLGYVWIEQRTGFKVVVKRLLGALAMIGAIALYFSG